MKAHLSILPHTMNTLKNFANSVGTKFGLSVIALLTILNAKEAQATATVIDDNKTKTGVALESADKPGYYQMTPGETGTPPPPEAKNTAGGDPDYIALMNGLTSKDPSNNSLEELNKKLTEAERILATVPETDEDSQLTLLKFISKIKKIKKVKEADKVLADLRAENKALTTENKDRKGNIAKIDTEKEALDKDLADEKEELRKTQEKLKIVKTNSNPQ